MASVSSLDKDLRKMRLDKYTPQAANEVREWIESVLNEQLAKGDLLDALKDGIALCKLANLAAPSANVKYKTSSMPFVQMENISHFLRACQAPPLNLQPHDVFLTVDLYEHKDPAQVLQCLGAFSRVANQLQPSRFPSAIGPRVKSGIMSPQGTGSATPPPYGGSRARGTSNASNGSSAYGASRVGVVTPTKTGDSDSGRRSPNKNGTMSPVSSWSRRTDEGVTAPAWNIAQYGYMGGASQGNMGISFGGRRQITSAGPYVPNMAEKEKKRKEKEAEEERMRQQMEEAEHRRRVEREAEEERARIAEEERWAEETRKLREQERLKVEEEKRKWEEEERRWKEEEERRQREEKEAEERLEKERRRARGTSDARLQGQFLSQYQAEQGIGVSRGDSGNSGASGSSRIQELELELARERERQYERERQEKIKSRSQQQDHDFNMRMKEEGERDRDRERSKARSRSRSRPRHPPRPTAADREDEEWRADEREYLRNQWAKQQHHAEEHPPSKPPRPVYDMEIAPAKPPRPLPETDIGPPKPPRPGQFEEDEEDAPPPPVRLVKNNTGPSSRPLPDPKAYTSPPQSHTPTFTTPSPNPPQNRTDRYLSTHTAPTQSTPKPTYSSELGAFDSTAERDVEDTRRATSQAKTKAGGWASKSLLEREMELERQRQKEWEEGQKESQRLSPSGRGVDGIGGGIGGKWDVGQWSGYTGGDGMNRGNLGVGAGRRQIVGPRPPPGSGASK